MGILANIYGRFGAALKAFAAERPVYGGYGGWIGDPWPMNPPGSTVDYVALAGDPDRNGVVAICKRWLRVNAATGPRFSVGQIDNATGEYEPDPDHELVEVLKNPNPFMSWAELIAATVDDLAYPGFAYWLKVRPRNFRNGSPLEFHYLDRRHVQVQWARPGDKRPIRGYDVYNGAGEPRFYDATEVVHFRHGQDPQNQWQGYSPLNDLLRSIATLNTGEDTQAAMMNSGHRITLISPKEGMASTWDENTSRSLVRLIKGASTQGRTRGFAGLPFAFDTHEIGFSPDEASPGDTLDWPSAMIVAGLGLNELVLGLPGSANTRTYSNLGEAYKQGFEAGLMPNLVNVADGIQQSCLRPLVDADGRSLPPDFGDGTLEAWFDNSDVAGLKEAEDAIAARITTLWQADLLRWDEARDAVGRTPIGDERGELFFSELGQQRAMEIMEGQAKVEAEAAEAGREDEPADEDETPPRVVADDSEAA